LALLAALSTATACHQPTKLVVTSCVKDSDCKADELCVDGTCVAQSKFRCDVVQSGAGVLQPAPHVVDFGTTGSDLVSQTITLRNIGNCSLTIFDAKIDGKDSPFTCTNCSDKDFPIEIFPMRQKDLTINFTAPKVGSFEDKLELLSDDSEFADLLVPIRARFDGVPKMVVSPDPVKFGYVAQGVDSTRPVQLTNHGTGVATVKVTDVHLDPPDTTAFSLEDSVDHPLPTSDKPIVLDPTGVDPRAEYVFTVHYHPREVADSQVDLVIVTDTPQVGTLRVSVSGTSQTPPQLSVSPQTVDFGSVPLGQMMALPLTLVNQGGSALNLTYSFRNNCPPNNPKCSTDFSFTPATLPPIDPGGFFEMQVFVQPTSIGPIQGLLIIGSNDPSRPTTTIQIAAEGINSGMVVAKVEVNYDNGTDGAFDDDLRRLDFSLESPYGFLCDKADPKPTDWGDFGNPSWMALGAKLNPQRVILVGPKQDGKFRVLLQYTEDCASLPSQLLASLLGISVDVLIAYLTGGVVNIDPGAVSKAIDQLCFSHQATSATVTVWINGVAIAEKTDVTLSKKGDFKYALDLTYENGKFTAQ
jgi:hypothetical protein